MDDINGSSDCSRDGGDSSDEATPVEALTRFAAWLTTSPKAFSVGGSEVVYPLFEAFRVFVEANQLGSCRPNYTDFLVAPAHPQIKE